MKLLRSGDLLFVSHTYISGAAENRLSPSSYSGRFHGRGTTAQSARVDTGCSSCSLMGFMMYMILIGCESNAMVLDYIVLN